MNVNHMGLKNIIPKSKRDEVPINIFVKGLGNIGYRCDNMELLISEIDRDAADFIRGSKQGLNSPQPMSLARLKHELQKGQRLTQTGTEAKLARFDGRTRQNIEKISQFIQQNNMTVRELHEKLDANRDGKLEKHEFVGGLRRYDIRGLNQADLGLIFDALDINHDGSLSLDEFGMFLEGAKRNRQTRIKNMDPETLR